MGRLIKRIKEWWLINGDKVLFRKALLEREYILEDDFGILTVPFKIYREFSLKNGITYRVCVSDMHTSQDTIYQALSCAVFHVKCEREKQRILDYIPPKSRERRS